MKRSESHEVDASKRSSRISRSQQTPLDEAVEYEWSSDTPFRTSRRVALLRRRVLGSNTISDPVDLTSDQETLVDSAQPDAIEVSSRRTATPSSRSLSKKQKKRRKTGDRILSASIGTKAGPKRRKARRIHLENDLESTDDSDIAEHSYSAAGTEMLDERASRSRSSSKKQKRKKRKRDRALSVSAGPKTRKARVCHLTTNDRDGSVERDVIENSASDIEILDATAPRTRTRCSSLKQKKRNSESHGTKSSAKSKSAHSPAFLVTGVSGVGSSLEASENMRCVLHEVIQSLKVSITPSLLYTKHFLLLLKRRNCHRN